MKHFRQRDGVRECGQVAVAALTEVDPMDVVLLVGHAHGTQTRELIAVLQELGWDTDTRCIPARRFKEPPQYALAQVHGFNRPGWHWVALAEGKIYDGCLYREKTLDSYLERIAKHNARITSYLPVRKLEMNMLERIANTIARENKDVPTATIPPQCHIKLQKAVYGDTIPVVMGEVRNYEIP